MTMSEVEVDRITQRAVTVLKSGSDAEVVAFVIEEIEKPVATIARVKAFAQSNAIAAHALRHSSTERAWLDLLAIIESEGQ